MSDDYQPLTPELTAYMLRAVQAEIAELRRELHECYLNEAQMRNQFYSREEHDHELAVRRDWPTRIFAGIAALSTLGTLIAIIAGAH